MAEELKPDAGRDWPEDAEHENGKYMCVCVQCGNHFIGHKRRIQCRICDNTAAAWNTRTPDPELTTLRARVKELEEDAARWNALLRCGKINVIGSAGFNPKTGERRLYSNTTGKFVPSSGGSVHFTAEFWSSYPGYEDDDKAGRWGTVALKVLADEVLRSEAEARTLLEGAAS